MDKDVREIGRRKCACGECEDFMRSDEATCGCLPTRRSKNARYSFDLVGGTSGAGTSASPEKWKDEDLVGSRTQRANILNSQIVFPLNSNCPYRPPVPTRNVFADVSRLKESSSGKFARL